MRLSLSTKLALVFLAITFIAVAGLYVYVAPGLQTRLRNEKLAELARVAKRYSSPVAHTVGRSIPEPVVKARVGNAAAASGDRVTLLSVALTAAGVQIGLQADSSSPFAASRLRFPAAYAAVRSQTTSTAVENSSLGTFAEAAYPISFESRVVKVIVYSTAISDIARDVATVRHEILVAGGLALLLAMGVGYLVARALTRRVKRLERAAETVAAGEFEHPISVDSRDELGQLAVAFNAMQRQLAQLDSARKKFIATASHELRTPIFSLGGFVELLEDEDLDPETRSRFLEQVRDQVDRLRKLSVDLLEISQLEAGSVELRPEQVDVRELVRSVSGEFEPTLDQHDSDLELRLPARAIEALCDPVRVAQIMRILIDNALTHTPHGTRVVVTAAQQDGHVRMSVRDNGDGIDPQSSGRIFEPFYTADNAQGSGLGLAIARELAERMSGRLSVSSRPGDTSFTLVIPA